MTRRQARRDLQTFIEYTKPRWTAGKIHRAICAQLERVLRKEIDRLMLLCPPQHGKSDIASRRFPAFVLGHDPTLDVLSASAAADLAEDFGRDVRNCIGSQEFRNLFPETRLAEDSQAKGRWKTQQGGSYYATGIGGQLFGKGGLAIIDDPFGSWTDAQSQLQRDKVWEWYTGTLYNRIRPGQPIIVIQHRMHEDDLAGRLIERQKEGGDKWEIIELPAELDDPPWIERYDRAALERIKANSDPRQWSALYMQNPTPEEGTYFRREWFADNMYDPVQLPEDISKWMTSDFGVTTKSGDRTSIGVHGWDQDGDLYLALDYWGGQTAPDVWIDEACNLMLTHHPETFFGEAGVIRRSVEPFLMKRMEERNVNVRVEWIASISDKPARARALQGRASMGKVHLPDNEVGHRILHQMLAFPGGKEDDDVDMCGMMGRVIDEAHVAVAHRMQSDFRSVSDFA